MKRILEISVDSFASARAAIEGGADRLELCSAFPLGGLSPFPELLAQIREMSNVKIRCLMRPRSGDFLYTKNELDLMCAQMKQLKRLGADGFVIGVLKADGTLDVEAMSQLQAAADGLPLTLHRCIDVSRDLSKTYQVAKDLGIDTILTSGGKASCIEGLSELQELLMLQEQGGPTVMIGAGVNSAVITEILAQYPQVRAFHMSGKMELESGMLFRRGGVPMGLPGLDEWHILQTDTEKVKAAREAVDR